MNNNNGYGQRQVATNKHQQFNNNYNNQYKNPFASLKRGRQIGANNNNNQLQYNNNNKQNHLGIKGQASQIQSQYQQAAQMSPYQSSSNNNNNEIALSSLLGSPSTPAQFVNAANVQDINKITAAINAENAASAAAALAQADMAFGEGVPAYMMNPMQQQQQHRPQHQGSSAGPLSRPMSQYASGLQTAASALLANTHPMIQAAASNGIGSVSKLGAKLGEMISLPSMQVPNVMNSLSSSLPVALSSWSTQVAGGLNQAVQQVAKEHPSASAFARQIAQQAGIQLPQLGQQQHQGASASLLSSAGSEQQHSSSHQLSPSSAASLIAQQTMNSLRNGNRLVNPLSQMQAAASQMMAASSSLLPSQMVPGPQSSLQQLRFSLGQNLQTAAAQFMAASQKSNAQSAASLLASPLSSLYPASVNAALKQLSIGQMSAGNPQQQAAGLQESQHAQGSSLVPVQSSPDQPPHQMVAASSSNGSPLFMAQLMGANKQQFAPVADPSSYAMLSAAAPADGSSQGATGDLGSSLAAAFSSQLTGAKIPLGFASLISSPSPSSSSSSGSASSSMNQAVGQQQQQQQTSSSSAAPILSTTASASSGSSNSGTSSSVSPNKPSSFKSKFLSFFQPPKFISNLLSWNDRVGQRQDGDGTPDLLHQDSIEADKSDVTSTVAKKEIKSTEIGMKSSAESSNIDKTINQQQDNKSVSSQESVSTS